MKLRHVNIFITFIAASLILGACNTSFDEIKYSDGNADFSRIVAIGGSHFSGYSDRALYLESQTNSIPSILAERLSFAGGGKFVQPLVNPGVGIGNFGNSKYVLRWIPDPCATGDIIVAQPISSTGDISNYNWLGNSVRFNNLSVPNTRIIDVSRQSYGDPNPLVGNPLYARFATNPGSSTVTGDALLINPTFFMVWLGMEDIFFYARTGGDQGGDSISSVAAFNQSFHNLINELTFQQAKGIVLNIPSLTSFPFFTELPYNGLQLDAQEAASLNVLYATVDPSIHFVEGYNRYVIEDPNVMSGRRHINEGEYILQSIPVDSVNCKGWGTLLPIPGRYVLDAQEVQKIRNAVISYNSIITIASVDHNLALVDMNSCLAKLKDGVTFNGVHYSSSYLTGGVYSTDGFHFTQRGSALVANEMVSAINNFFNAKIPKVDVNSFQGLQFP